jgi:uncharacterized protein
VLSKALATLSRPPKVMVAASAVGFYGSQGARELTEDSPQGEGFLAEVAEANEEATQAAKAAGIRVVNLRLGVVLSSRGGAVQSMHLPFSLGLGGPVGAGTQFMSWLTLGDAVRVVEHCIQRSELSGPVNACSPRPCTSAEFASAYGRAVSRPAFLPMPEFAVNLLFGEMGRETLLVSHRAVPKKLLASGFRFWHGDIGAGMEAALSHHGGTEVASS